MSFDLNVQNGDLVIKNGDLDTVKGVKKLEQDLAKIALTGVGANPFATWYGSTISKSLIGSVLPPDIIFSNAQSQLQTAIKNLQNLQARQVKDGQMVTPDEQIAFIKQISLERNKIDPRIVEIVISVYTRAFSTVYATLSMRQ